MSRPARHAEEHLGDGVYVSHDGYHVVLRTGEGAERQTIYLEPKVYIGLRMYAQRVWAPPEVSP